MQNGIVRKIYPGATASGASLRRHSGIAGGDPARGDLRNVTHREDPAAAVVHAEYSFDDLLSENDRTAHRVYRRVLEAAEPRRAQRSDAGMKGDPQMRLDSASRQVILMERWRSGGECDRRRW